MVIVTGKALHPWITCNSLKHLKTRDLLNREKKSWQHIFGIAVILIFLCNVQVFHCTFFTALGLDAQAIATFESDNPVDLFNFFIFNESLHGTFVQFLYLRTY